MTAKLWSNLLEYSDKSAGIFIPVPKDHAKKFPSREEDPSPPHMTLLFIGDVTDKEWHTILRVLKKHCNEHVAPFTMTLGNYGEWKNAKGQTIAHMRPSTGDSDFAGLHCNLWDDLESAGISVLNYGHDQPRTGRYERFKPHITLAYMEPGQQYNGTMPVASWKVAEIEAWRGPDKIKIPLNGKPERLFRDSLDESYTYSVVSGPNKWTNRLMKDL